MKAKELRALSEAEIASKERELRTMLLKLYGQVSTGTAPKNAGQIRQSKRILARILTLRNEKKNAAAKTATPAAKPASKPAQKSSQSSKKTTMEARPKQ